MKNCINILLLRVAAFVIDISVILLYTSLVGGLIAYFVEAMELYILVILALIFSFIYITYTLFFWRATVGMMLLNLKITAVGGDLTLGRAIGRAFTFLLSLGTLGIFNIIFLLLSKDILLTDYLTSTRIE